LPQNSALELGLAADLVTMQRAVVREHAEDEELGSSHLTTP
jgi:hypothetical protein